MPIPKELSLTPEQLDELMLSSWNMRVATIGPGTRINVTPLWFGWGNGNIYFYCRGQKVVNLRRNPVATVLVDRNERFPELQGAMFQGKARVLETPEDENAEPGFEDVRWQMGKKYAGGHGESAEPVRNNSTARGRHWRWVVFTPEKTVTWDNFKIAQATGVRDSIERRREARSED
jgi:nitroimidazol reductase NimA-like FMN-containing flavoprotein (pyridoxamine 5'-phosphate oxidase superfamily)